MHSTRSSEATDGGMDVPMVAPHGSPTSNPDPGNPYLRSRIVVPRTAPLLNRYPGNVRKDLLESFLSLVWTSLMANLANPIQIQEDATGRAWPDDHARQSGEAGHLCLLAGDPA